MLYYYIDEIANVNAVICDAGDGDHQNDRYDNDALFSMTFPDDHPFHDETFFSICMTRMLGASPAPVKHRHQ
jgi:hypothetical protein